MITPEKTIILYITGIFLLLTISLTAKKIQNETDWSKCPELNVNEITDLLTDRKKNSYRKNICYADDELFFILEGEYKSVFKFKNKREFMILPTMNFEDEQIIYIFRKLELMLLRKIGTPDYFHKQGSIAGISDTLIRMRHGAAKYITVWNVNGEKITLLLGGEDLGIFLSCRWN